MSGCKICGKQLSDDLFSAVTGEPMCTVCKVKYIGGLPTTPARIAEVREKLGLADGELLEQDNAEECRRILGR